MKKSISCFIRSWFRLYLYSWDAFHVIIIQLSLYLFSNKSLSVSDRVICDVKHCVRDYVPFFNSVEILFNDWCVTNYWQVCDQHCFSLFVLVFFSSHVSCGTKKWFMQQVWGQIITLSSWRTALLSCILNLWFIWTFELFRYEWVQV